MGQGKKPLLLSKRMSTIACIVLVLLFFLWEGYSCWLWLKYRNLSLPHTFGNFEHNISTVETLGKARGEIRFAVLGDWRGYGTFEELLKNELDFIILLGDIARNPTDGDHKYLQARLTNKLLADYPVFYVPGNHDVGPSYTLRKWEQAYGPSQFFFKLDGNLFIFTYLIGSEAGLDYLEEILRHNASSAKRIFVFNHTPPDLGFNWEVRVLPHQERFIKLLDTYRVDYFIGGDYHGYARVRNGATTFMINGGAGADLDEGSGGFHFAMLFTIKGEMFQEKLCTLSSYFDPMRKLMYRAFVRFIPFVGMHRFTMVVINLASLAVVVMMVRILYRSVRNGAQTEQLQSQKDLTLKPYQKSIM